MDVEGGEGSVPQGLPWDGPDVVEAVVGVVAKDAVCGGHGGGGGAKEAGVEDKEAWVGGFGSLRGTSRGKHYCFGMGEERNKKRRLRGAGL